MKSFFGGRRCGWILLWWLQKCLSTLWLSTAALAEPDAIEDELFLNQDETATINVLTNDVVGGTGVLALIYVDKAAFDLGTMTFTSNGVVTVVASASAFLGEGERKRDIVSYEVVDGNGNGDFSSLDITVTGVNDPPVAVDDSTSTDEDTSVVIAVLDNDSDVDNGDTISISSVDTTTGTMGLVTITGNNILYDPNGQFEFLAVGETATDHFAYTIADSMGATDMANVTITIIGVNDQPVAQPDVVFTTKHCPVKIFPLENDSDIDSSDELTLLSVDDSDTVGLVSVSGNNAVIYKLNGNFHRLPKSKPRRDTFHYSVSDGNGGIDTATVTVVVKRGAKHCHRPSSQGAGRKGRLGR